MDYISYITREGDRWDLIAYRYYGNPYRYQELIEANIAALGSMPPPILESGIKLQIPQLPTEAVQAENLPPWKR